jgi:cAMP phosphodiesterase
MMKIQVLGGHGGLSKGFETTSFLIDDKLLIDAGAVASTLTIEQQVNIDNILISHCHLDHIKDLAFISDNCFGLKNKAFQVHTHQTVKDILKTHFLNDVIWPDFTILPNEKNPTIVINAIPDEQTLVIGEYAVTPVKVKHAHDAMGFIIEKDGSAVLFTLDTGPTERIWEFAKKNKKLKAIFTEVSFPNVLEKVALLSDHHTPKSMQQELSKMPEGIPVILTHLKPNYRQDILKEIEDIGEDRIRVLDKDGEIFKLSDSDGRSICRVSHLWRRSLVPVDNAPWISWSWCFCLGSVNLRYCYTV